MQESREAYSWPEMTLYAFTGGTSALAAYAENVDIAVERSLKRKLVFGATAYSDRVTYVEQDKVVSMTVGSLYAGLSWYSMLQSGANISATVNFLTSGDNSTARFILWSAQAVSFSLQGSDGQLWKQTVRLAAPDISGL